MSMKRIASVLLSSMILCGFVLSACSRETQRADATIQDYLPLAIDGKAIRAQVAATEPEQEKGLMFRENLPDGDGMLFVYKTPQKMHYWMNHVPIPLSIGFFRADGTLDEVRAMLPNDTRDIASSSDLIQYCLEMNEDWYARSGIKPGAKLDMGLVKKTLEARGEETDKYGLK